MFPPLLQRLDPKAPHVPLTNAYRLMATLGPRSKRVTRKDIAKIDLERTCELIARPPEPMAMRLSATLLYGASRWVSVQAGL